MIKGKAITVKLRDRSARDGFGNDVIAYASPEEVGNVVVQRGSCAELDATRPEGVRVAYTLHFPKGWSGDLRGAVVALGTAPAATPAATGTAATATTWSPQWYRVIGDPRPYMDENCPTPWHMPVEVEAVDG